jgi:hypothetical protein
VVERKSLTGFLKCESETEVGDKIPPDNPYGSLDALLKAEVGVDEEAINTEVLDSHGGDRRSKEVKSRLSNNLEKPKQGTSTSYLQRRMKRDFPETLDKLEAGEYKSTRQAYRTSSLARIWL